MGAEGTVEQVCAHAVGGNRHGNRDQRRRLRGQPFLFVVPVAESGFDLLPLHWGGVVGVLALLLQLGEPFHAGLGGEFADDLCGGFALTAVDPNVSDDAARGFYLEVFAVELVVGGGGFFFALVGLDEPEAVGFVEFFAVGGVFLCGGEVDFGVGVEDVAIFVYPSFEGDVATCLELAGLEGAATAGGGGHVAHGIGGTARHTGLGAGTAAGGFAVVDACEGFLGLLVVLDDVLVFGSQYRELPPRGDVEVATGVELRTHHSGVVACFERYAAFAA